MTGNSSNYPEALVCFDSTFYKNIAEQARDIILVVVAGGEIVDGNLAAETAYGYSKDELRHMRVHDLRSPETRAAADAHIKRAQQEGFLFRTVHMRRNGECFPVEVSSRPFRFNGREAIISIVRDISEAVALETALKKSEEKFRTLNERLIAANEELTATEEELRQQCDELLAREAEIQRQNVILTSLHETAKGLMQRLDVNEVLAAIVSNAAELIGTSHGFINILDEKQAVFERKIGLGYYAQDVGRKTKLTEGFGGQVYKTGEITVIDDYGASETRLSGSFFDRIYEVVLVPLKKEGKVIGVFGLSYLEPNRKFNSYEISLLTRFADLASLALVNAHLHSSLSESEKKLQRSHEDMTAVHEELLAADEELKQQFDELLVKEEALRKQTMILTSLHDTALGLMHRHDPDDLLKMIVAGATELVGTPHGFIYHLDKPRGVFVRSQGLGIYAQDIGREIPVDEGIVGTVYRSGEPVIVNDYQEWRKHNQASAPFEKVYSVLQIPLKSEGQIIGTIGLGYSEENKVFGPGEIEILNRFAELASIALDNAMLVTSFRKELLERRQAEEALQMSEARYRAVFEAANDGIYIHDLATGNILDVNEKACELCGYSREEILSGKINIMAAGEAPYSETEALQWMRRAAGGEPQLYEWKYKHRDNHYVWVEINLKRALIGREDRILAVVRDISERKVQEKAIRRMAYYDALTGLPNRRYLQECLVQELEKANRGETKGAILFVDMDDLKMINDTLGHSYGDGVIIKAGAYLFAEAGETAVVARIGGDEFIVLLPGESDRERVAHVANNMVKLLSRDYEVGASRTHMSASIGIALYPLHGDTAEDIFKNADLALYAAKGSGKNTWRFYEPNLQIIAYENMMLKRGLREAIEREELSLHYQPLVEAQSGRLISFEALLRWTNSGREAVSPGRFIPLAEESDTINIIGKWVIGEACRFARKLAEAGKDNIRVSVNVSPRQLVADDFVAIVSQAITQAGIKPNQLEIEITENALIASLEDSINKLRELRAIGVHLALDDFGTGYSSLTYLRSLPVGMLKIDKSFIDRIAFDEAQLQFIRSIVNMAHVLGLTVVAEGVEYGDQLAKLVECRCDFIQGYFISQPAPEKEAISFLDRSGPGLDDVQQIAAAETQPAADLAPLALPAASISTALCKK